MVQKYRKVVCHLQKYHPKSVAVGKDCCS